MNKFADVYAKTLKTEGNILPFAENQPNTYQEILFLNLISTQSKKTCWKQFW